MTLRGNTSQACAACKYQRRKCTPECPLAPYFPPDQPKMFQNVHKLFGVKKIQKMLEALHPTQQNDAMSSIIYQAEIRDRFPVYGCVQVIQHLKSQIRQWEEEIYATHTMLGMYRQQQDQQISSDSPSLNNVNSPSQQLQLGMAPPTNDAPSFYLNATLPQSYNSTDNGILVSQNSNSGSNDSAHNSSIFDLKDAFVNSMWIQQPYGSGNENSNSDTDNPMPIQSQLITSQSPDMQPDGFQDYDDMQPYFDSIDDRQSFIDTKDEYASSPDSVAITTQTVEHISENELKSAAACFSLTSVNLRE